MKVLGRVKAIVNGVLEPIGQVIPREGCVPSLERFVNHAKRARLTPVTVFDIGVAKGTPWLYRAFLTAKIVLVDPTRESLPAPAQPAVPS